MDKIRVGLLGCGGYGDPRATAPYATWLRQGQAWQAQTDATLVGIADPNADFRTEAAASLQIPRDHLYHSFSDMQAQEKLDVVVITAFPQRQTDLAIEALSTGVSVIINKPMSTDLSSADAMVETARRSGARLAVLHQARVGRLEREMQRLVREGRIGRIVEIEGAGKGYYGGYDLFNQCTHLLNSFRGIMRAPFAWVAADIHCGERLADAADIVQAPNGFGLIVGQHVRLHVGFTDGTVGIANHLHQASPEARHAYMLVRGTEGALWLSWGPPRIFLSHNARPHPDEAWEAIALPEEALNPLEMDIAVAHEMVQALREGREHECSGVESLAGMEAVMAGLASHFTAGQRVLLPPTERRHPLELVLERNGLDHPPSTPQDYSSWLQQELARLESLI